MRQTFLTVVTIAVSSSTGLTLAAEPESRREQAIATLLKRGVKVDRDETKPGQPVTRIFFGCHRSPGSLVRELQYVPEVEVLNLRLKDDVTEEDLRSLRALTNLRELLIHHCPIDDKSIAHLKPISSLRTLQFSQTPISDEGVKHLAELKKLESLRIDGKGVTDRSMIYLERLSSLKKLRLSRTSVTEERLTALRSSLPGTSITND